MSLLKKLFFLSPSPEACFQLAFEAETKNSNYGKAAKLYEKAAKKGLAKAQFYCGYMYIKGRGVKRDYEKAFSLVREAALQNHPQAQYLLAQMYYSGEGIEKNTALGDEWIAKYKEHNLPEGRLILSFHNF
ncbi:tetratricopeptide repeat protein [Parasediminibacterium sp. JCM 36343]|uniref:tetratricopeptide repeat protein n=1 Tax=Parasediminibacterium sp. JCM 36343 TaxID=3374279 RepID=UPI00397AE02F